MNEPTPERVAAIVRDIAGPTRSPDDAGPETPLVDGGFWLDSMHLLEVLMSCEAEFAVVFDTEADLTDRNLTTVGTLCDLIRAKQIG